MQKSIQERTKASLLLSNGLKFEGFSFGYDHFAEGEVVFDTAMVGYPESLTDPSFAGQILCITYPLIGNYGVPEDQFIEGISQYYESDKIHVKGLIITEYSYDYSHWSALKSLDQWLKEHKIVGIYGVDTREITKVLRDQGSMVGKIITENHTEASDDDNCGEKNLVKSVSCSEPIIYNKGGEKRVLLLDCGVKHTILRALANKNIEVVRVPYDYKFNNSDLGECDGLLISNGPGNCSDCETTIDEIKKFMESEKPILGIGMGNLLLAKAAGAEVIKLKCGHRGPNQPVRMVGTERCFITSQCHGYSVDAKTLPSDWKESFINLNDNSNEGIQHLTKPFTGVQFHPEGVSGPIDTKFIFDNFIEKL